MPAEEPKRPEPIPEHARPIDVRDPRVVAAIDRYWRRNLLLMTVLLAIWAVVGLGCGVLLADQLNAIVIGGFPLGFWFAQQGSIVVFVVLILVYAILLNRYDAQHHRELDEILGPKDENGQRPASGGDR